MPARIHRTPRSAGWTGKLARVDADQSGVARPTIGFGDSRPPGPGLSRRRNRSRDSLSRLDEDTIDDDGSSRNGIFEAAYGPDHPEVARTLTNLGLVLRGLGDLAGARAHQERALRINEAAYGPDHSSVAITLTSLGLVLRDLGDLAGARAQQERALRINEAAYSPDHSHTRTARRALDAL